MGQSLELCAERGDAQLGATITYEQSALARSQGDLAGLAGCGLDTGWSAQVTGLEHAADLLTALGQPAIAVRLYGATVAVRELQGTPVLPGARAAYENDLQVLRGIPDIVFDDAWARGCR